LLDWIAQSELQTNLVDWIVIDNPKSKSDFGFGLSIQFCHFNPNSICQNYFIKKLKFHAPTMLSQATFYPFSFKQNFFSKIET